MVVLTGRGSYVRRPTALALQDRRVVVVALFGDLAADDFVHGHLVHLGDASAGGQRDAALPLDDDGVAVGSHRAGREGRVAHHAAPHGELLLDRVDADARRVVGLLRFDIV